MLFSEDIEKLTLENEDYRRVLFTSKYSQLVLMSIPVGEDIHVEVHPNTDQFFRFEQGAGEIVSGNQVYPVKDGSGVIVPYNTRHQVVNIGDVPLKLYTIYSPPQHPPGLVQKNKPEDDFEKFDYPVLQRVTSFLTPHDLIAFCSSGASDKAKKLCDNPSFWQENFKKHFGAFVPHMKDFELNTKEKYLYLFKTVSEYAEYIESSEVNVDYQEAYTAILETFEKYLQNLNNQYLIVIHDKIVYHFPRSVAEQHFKMLQINYR